MPEPKAPSLGPADADELLWYAVAAIRSGLERRPVPGIRHPDGPALNALGATFVTLEHRQQLLGCIGSLEAVRPLYEDVMANAYKSAFADPRVPAVTPAQFAEMDVKVSVLSPTVPIPATGRRELLDSLEPGVDGLLLVADGFRVTFLPAVWERATTAAEFVDLLLRKGRVTETWIPGLAAYRYRTTEYRQSGPRPPAAL